MTNQDIVPEILHQVETMIRETCRPLGGMNQVTDRLSALRFDLTGAQANAEAMDRPAFARWRPNVDLVQAILDEIDEMVDHLEEGSDAWVALVACHRGLARHRPTFSRPWPIPQDPFTCFQCGRPTGKWQQFCSTDCNEQAMAHE